jgi:hypothetical protein
MAAPVGVPSPSFAEGADKPHPGARSLAGRISRILVMAGLVPAIHEGAFGKEDVDARHKAGHDGGEDGECKEGERLCEERHEEQRSPGEPRGTRGETRGSGILAALGNSAWTPARPASPAVRGTKKAADFRQRPWRSPDLGLLGSQITTTLVPTFTRL